MAGTEIRVLRRRSQRRSMAPWLRRVAAPSHDNGDDSSSSSSSLVLWGSRTRECGLAQHVCCLCLQLCLQLLLWRLCCQARTEGCLNAAQRHVPQGSKTYYSRVNKGERRSSAPFGACLTLSALCS